MVRRTQPIKHLSNRPNHFLISGVPTLHCFNIFRTRVINNDHHTIKTTPIVPWSVSIVRLYCSMCVCTTSLWAPQKEGFKADNLTTRAKIPNPHLRNPQECTVVHTYVHHS